jgi:FKBP-type peptidyl-prolyl cis-trans isomerase SlyD
MAVNKDRLDRGMTGATLDPHMPLAPLRGFTIHMLLVLAALVPAAPLIAAAQSSPAPAETPSAASNPPAESPAIEQGSTVQLEYTLTDDAGAVLDTNKGQAPLTYTHGEAQIIPGLERQLAGMHTGEEKKVTLPPGDAYGPVDPAAQTEVARDALPPAALVVGTRLIARNAAGDARPVVVKEIRDQTVVIDLNHPLAGKTLVFEVKVLSVESPKAPEPKAQGAKPAN